MYQGDIQGNVKLNSTWIMRKFYRKFMASYFNFISLGFRDFKSKVCQKSTLISKNDSKWNQ